MDIDPNISYHVYIDDDCLHITQTEVQAKTFIEMLGKAGRRGRVVKINKNETKDEDDGQT